MTNYERLMGLLPGIDHDDCVSPPGKPMPHGYGQVWIDRHTHQLSHIVACEWAHGAKPGDKTEVAHSCGARFCVNPRHLRWATHTENMRDAIDHGTFNTGRHDGERNGRAKLTSEDVTTIRGRLSTGELHRVIAADYGLSRPTITAIATGRNWGLR